MMSFSVAIEASNILFSRSSSESPDDSSPKKGTSSTVLFFLALAIGVAIGLLFVFFTVRYFVRSKYGVHIYPTTSRGIFMGGRPEEVNQLRDITDEELQNQLDFIRNSDDVRAEILSRWLSNRNRHTHRRKVAMKKLSAEEVDRLFPRITYGKWLDRDVDGQKDAVHGILEEEAEPTKNRNEEISERTLSSTPEREERSNNEDLGYKEVPLDSNGDEAIELEIVTPSIGARVDCNRTLSQDSSSLRQSHAHDLHFTSGSCAICLEVIDEDDLVRGLLCGHVFHADCIDPWLTKRRACCPMCKRNYCYKKGSSQESGGANIGNAATSQSNLQNSNSESANDDSNSINQVSDINSLNLRLIRDDPILFAFIQELVPIGERVQTLLNDESLRHLNLESEGKKIARKKYGYIFWPILWKIMGVKKTDIFNWAVINLYREHCITTEQASSSNAQAQSNAENNNTINVIPSEIDHRDSDNTSVDSITMVGREDNAYANEQENGSSESLSQHPLRVAVDQQFVSRDIVDQRV